MQIDEMPPRKDSPNRLSILAAQIEEPQVVAEIDKVLNAMRQEWLDIMDLRKAAIRRHGDGGLPIPAALAEVSEAAPVQNDPGGNSQPAWTVAELVSRYRDDPASPYHKVSFVSRTNYDAVISLILRDHGHRPLSEVNARVLTEWHAAWSDGGKIAVAHSKIGMLRRMFGFGASVLEDAECLRLATVLHTMRFKMPKRRKEQLTAEWATAIRAKAHERGRKSVALAQAFQFDLGLTQKSAIGDWVPESEAGAVASDITAKGYKWIQGIRWSDIDENMVLRFSAPGQDEPLAINLRQAPMVMEELKLCCGFDGNRSSLPKNGAVIKSEQSGLPWDAVEFRRWWRTCANACGVPKNVRNMDSRVKVGRRPSQDYVEDDEEEEFESGEEMSLH